MKTSRFSASLFAGLVGLMLMSIGSLRAQEVVTVTWWTEEGLFLEHVQNTFVKAFNESHPNIKIELVGQQQINDVLRTAFQAGEAPDILQTPGAAFIAEYIDAGLILPLDEASEAGGWKEKLLPWAYESGIINGSLYSVPLTYESMVLYYNKTLFEENGWVPPTTLEELDALAQNITAAGKHVFTYSNAEFKPSNEHLVGVYLNNLVGPDNVYKALLGEKSWTDPEFASAIDLLKTHMVDNGWYSGSLENYYTYTDNDVLTELATGEAAMMISGTWQLANMKTFFTPESGSDWDWAPIPTLSDAVTDYNYLLATGSTLSINGQAKNPAAAAEVLNFLLSDPKLALANAAGSDFGEWMVPLRYETSDFPEDADPRVVRFFSDFATVTGEGRYGYTTWTFWPAKPNVQLWQEIESVWAGDLTTADYLAAQQSEWDDARAENATLPIPKRN